MTYYLDASVCVAALTPENGTKRVQAWLALARPTDFAMSMWVHAEVASALSIKVRTGSLTSSERAIVVEAWTTFRQALRMLDILDRSFEAAAGYVARHTLALRAGDALHLAIAARAGCTLVTLDERMAKAAPELGVPVAALD